VYGVGQCVDAIGVVEWLRAEGLEEVVRRDHGAAVVDVGVGLDDPDELLAGVVEVGLELGEELPTLSSPVYCSCSMRYSWGLWATRLRSSTSRKM
jgi:hypothetical protein